MSKKIRVVVVYGGKSSEHEVSIQSARTVAEALDPAKYERRLVYIDRDGRWVPMGTALPEPGKIPAIGNGGGELVPAKALAPSDDLEQVVFPVLHGPHGEDGTVQGLLELAGVPYVGCGVLASSVGMDKDVTQRLAESAGLRVPPRVLVREGDALKPALAKARKLGFPVYVKPVRQGSSVGVRRVNKASELGAAVTYAFQFDSKVLIEKGIQGMEVAVAVLGDDRRAEAAVPGAIVPKGKHEFFSYEAKYLDPDGFEFTIPAPLPKAKLEELKRSAVEAFRAVEAFGMARCDFLLDKSKKVYFGEVNTIPGFTSHSLYPKLWEASGLPLPKLLDRLIALAIERARRTSRLKTTPDA